MIEALIRNEIVECLECGRTLEHKTPSQGDVVFCDRCGHIHTVVLSWRLEGTGHFKPKEKLEE